MNTAKICKVSDGADNFNKACVELLILKVIFMTFNKLTI